MNLTSLFDAKLGGQTRAAVVTAIAVVAWVASILGAIDLDAPIIASIPAILQILAHGTPWGNKEVPA